MIKIENISGNILKVTPPEKLQVDDFARIAPQVDAFVGQYGKVKLLIDATKFGGWENLQAFENHMGFVKGHHRKVEAIAILAGHDWQHWVAGTASLFLHPAIKVFDKSQEGEAREWLNGQAKAA